MLYLEGKSESNDCGLLIRNHRGQIIGTAFFNMLKEKNCQPTILDALKRSFRNEDVIRNTQLKRN